MTQQINRQALTDTQKIFTASKANGADNMQDVLPTNYHPWPTQTWLSRRLAELRKGKPDEKQTPVD